MMYYILMLIVNPILNKISRLDISKKIQSCFSCQICETNFAFFLFFNSFLFSVFSKTTYPDRSKRTAIRLIDNIL